MRSCGDGGAGSNIDHFLPPGRATTGRDERVIYRGRCCSQADRWADSSRSKAGISHLHPCRHKSEFAERRKWACDRRSQRSLYIESRFGEPAGATCTARPDRRRRDRRQGDSVADRRSEGVRCLPPHTHGQADYLCAPADPRLAGAGTAPGHAPSAQRPCQAGAGTADRPRVPPWGDGRRSPRSGDRGGDSCLSEVGATRPDSSRRRVDTVSPRRGAAAEPPLPPAAAESEPKSSSTAR
jgi:hypothetical protein